MDCELYKIGTAADGKHRYTCRWCKLPPYESTQPPERIHRSCPARPTKAAPPEIWPEGPGTELKRLLAKVGIVATHDCPCNEHAREMNRRGAEWCIENIDTIVGWLSEEAQRRKMPFVAAAARWLVKMAIRNAIAQS